MKLLRRGPWFSPPLQTAALLFSFATSLLSADEIIQKLEAQDFMGKKTYLNVRVMGVTEKGLKISHDSGISILALKSLPAELALKYAPQEQIPQASTEKELLKMVDSREEPGSAAAISSSFDPSCLVIIKTNSGSGSGFIAQSEGKTFVYTNAHVICGRPGSFTQKIVSVRTGTGREIPIPFELELSLHYDPNASHGLEDVARFPVTVKEGEVAYQIKAPAVTEYMNREVIAYGNSQGMDVLTSLKGQVIGLGTDRIEISCEIVPGNSGGPVVLADTKQVIGISTYLQNGGKDIWSKGTTFEGIRRFAVRPEQVTKWRKMQLTSLITSLSELQAFERDTLSLAAACYLDPRPNRGGFDMPSTQKGDYVVKQVILDGSKHTLGSTISSGIARVNQRLGAASATLAMQAVVPVFSEFFSSVAAKSSSQISALQTSDRVPYVKQHFAELIEVRKEVHAQFVKEGLSRFR